MYVFLKFLDFQTGDILNVFGMKIFLMVILHWKHG